jgi:hypothetical protein
MHVRWEVCRHYPFCRHAKNSFLKTSPAQEGPWGLTVVVLKVSFYWVSNKYGSPRNFPLTGSVFGRRAAEQGY